jgi:hypothetical protein
MGESGCLQNARPIAMQVQRVPRLLKVNNDKQRQARPNHAFICNGVVELFG